MYVRLTPEGRAIRRLLCRGMLLCIALGIVAKGGVMAYEASNISAWWRYVRLSKPAAPPLLAAAPSSQPVESNTSLAPTPPPPAPVLQKPSSPKKSVMLPAYGKAETIYVPRGYGFRATPGVPVIAYANFGSITNPAGVELKLNNPGWVQFESRAGTGVTVEYSTYPLHD